MRSKNGYELRARQAPPPEPREEGLGARDPQIGGYAAWRPVSTCAGCGRAPVTRANTAPPTLASAASGKARLGYTRPSAASSESAPAPVMPSATATEASDSGNS